MDKDRIEQHRKMVEKILINDEYIRTDLAHIPADFIIEKKTEYKLYRFEFGQTILFIHHLFYGEVWAWIYKVYHQTVIVPYVGHELDLIDRGIQNLAGKNSSTQEKEILERKLRSIYEEYKLDINVEQNMFQVTELMVEQMRKKMDFIDILTFAKLKEMPDDFLEDIDLLSKDFNNQLDKLKALELSKAINEIIPQLTSTKSQASIAKVVVMNEPPPIHKEIPLPELIKSILKDLEVNPKQKAVYVACAKILIDDDFKFQNGNSSKIIQLIKKEFGVEVLKNTINDCRKGKNHSFTDYYKKINQEIKSRQAKIDSDKNGQV